jgi:hypothetical protein
MTDYYKYCKFCGEKINWFESGHKTRCKAFQNIQTKYTLMSDIGKSLFHYGTKTFTNIFKQIYQEVNDRLPNFTLTVDEKNDYWDFLNKGKDFGLYVSPYIQKHCALIGDTASLDFKSPSNIFSCCSNLLVGFIAREDIKFEVVVNSFKNVYKNTFDLKKGEFVYALNNKYMCPLSGILVKNSILSISSTQHPDNVIDCVFATINPKLFYDDFTFNYLIFHAVCFRYDIGNNKYLNTNPCLVNLLEYAQQYPNQPIIDMPSCNVKVKPKRKMRKLN